MHISLTPQLENIIKDKVSSGLYGNASEVVRDALRQMDRYNQLFYDLKREHLLTALEKGEASGDSSMSVLDIMKESSINRTVRESVFSL